VGFCQLERGRVWTVHVASHERGDGLRHVDERYADDYALVAEADADLGSTRSG
jgi:hypothetical protein